MSYGGGGVVVADPEYSERGPIDMKYKPPCLVAIFFMTIFYRRGMAPLPPPPRIRYWEEGLHQRWIHYSLLTCYIYVLQVRGAPAIGVVGTLSLAVELHEKEFQSLDKLVSYVTERLNYLVRFHLQSRNYLNRPDGSSTQIHSLKKDKEKNQVKPICEVTPCKGPLV